MFEKLLSTVAGFVIWGISTLGYSGVAGMMAIESACIPLPSEVIMPFSGYLVSQGRFSLLGVTLAGSIGCVIGSVLAYWAGSRLGRGFLEKHGKYLLITRHDLDIADRFFKRYGDHAIFFSRMLPVVRTFISLPAGIAKMDFTKFVIFTFVGSLPWCWFLGYLGKKMGENWNTLGVYFHRFDFVIGMILLTGAAWFVWRHIRVRKLGDNSGQA